jgi:hypothetical protein
MMSGLTGSRADDEAFDAWGPQCNLCDIDIGIPVGSAAEIESLYCLDTRWEDVDDDENHGSNACCRPVDRGKCR